MNEFMLRLTRHPLVRRKETFLALVILVLGAFLSIRTDVFLTWDNLLDVLVNYSFLGIMSAGMLVVLISGHRHLLYGDRHGCPVSWRLHHSAWRNLLAFDGDTIGVVLGCLNGF